MSCGSVLQPTSLAFHPKSFWILCSSLRHSPEPFAPSPAHLPVPASVCAGSSTVLHGPPETPACLRRAADGTGCVPASVQTDRLGLLDLADHAMTITDHRGQQRAGGKNMKGQDFF